MLETVRLRALRFVRALMAAAQILERVAHSVGVDGDALRLAHLRDEGSPWLGVPMNNVMERQCWAAVLQMSGYEERKAAVANFNTVNATKKRGLAGEARAC